MVVFLGCGLLRILCVATGNRLRNDFMSCVLEFCRILFQKDTSSHPDNLSQVTSFRFRRADQDSNAFNERYRRLK